MSVLVKEFAYPTEHIILELPLVPRLTVLAIHFAQAIKFVPRKISDVNHIAGLIVHDALSLCVVIS